uniref:Phorbol-ester/DAG-type domain-containing protein n=1 Tax=Syphacia muris TaxID=451379 RepID=A0A0N5AX18_9BILA
MWQKKVGRRSRWKVTSNLKTFTNLLQELKDNKGMQLRVCRAVAYWIRMCPSHFDSELCRLLSHLRTLAVSAGITQAESLLDTSSLKSYSWLRNMSLRKPVTRQISLSFEQWCAEDISTSLSHIDYKALYRIPISELKTYCNEGKLTHTPVLERSIAIFNSLSNWVQYMILSKPTAIERSHIIAKFVDVGKHLRKLNNFNTLMAVIGGVSHSNIARLSKTHSTLPSHTKKELAKLTLLLSTQSNFVNYRRALKETEGQFRIPIMGVHLKDLIAWHCREGKENSSSKLSKRRIEHLANYLSYFVPFSRIQPNFGDPSPDLINTLKVSLDIRYNEEEIYKLSQKREPRLLLRFASTSRPTVFAEWASGVSCALDQETVNKHITAMVDAVFKHYDHNKDGFISQSEFQQIAGNFPFIAPFGTIDTDRDGQITKDEMKSYFITVNKQSMEFRRGFKHNFVEASFISPTSCGHCEKILWGPFCHGYKCKDCGLGVHVNCKDMVVVECRRKSSKTLGWW